MSYKYDTLVFIGRFQPVHNAHIEIIRKATELAHNVIVVVGSAKKPRTFKNPWTADERIKMLKEATSSLGRKDNIIFEQITDSPYNDQAWAVRIQTAVSSHVTSNDKIGIIGHKKDESTFYLDMFPQWTLEEVPLIEPLNATHIRELYFKKGANTNFLVGVVPPTVLQFMYEFQNTLEFTEVMDEVEFINLYKKQFESLPYPPIFVTTDAVVIQSGHVLMIKRKANPGKGLWALPGGFVNAATDRSVESAMLRELREETGIKVPAPVLSGSIKETRVFDAIDRSARGRTITHAFHIVLPDGELPRVKGADDAEKARWVPLAQVQSDMCFEDHYDIIRWAVGA